MCCRPRDIAAVWGVLLLWGDTGPSSGGNTSCSNGGALGGHAHTPLGFDPNHPSAITTLQTDAPDNWYTRSTSRHQHLRTVCCLLPIMTPSITITHAGRERRFLIIRCHLPVPPAGVHTCCCMLYCTAVFVRGSGTKRPGDKDAKPYQILTTDTRRIVVYNLKSSTTYRVDVVAVNK